MNSGNKPKLTLWSIPPFREHLRELAGKLRAREIRFAVAQVFGGIYLLYGMKIPVFVSFWGPLFEPNPAIIDFSSSGIPFTRTEIFLSGIFCGLAAGGIVWLAIGRAMQAARHNRIRYGFWGGLALGAPMLPLFAIAPPDGRLLLSATILVTTFFGASVGVLLCSVIRRDSAQRAGQT